MKISKILGAVFTLALILSAPLYAKGDTSSNKGSVNIYTSRHYDIDNMLYAAFTKETGIEVNIFDGKTDEVFERIKTEGANTQADIFFFVGANIFYRLKQLDSLDNLPDSIFKLVRENSSDPDKKWVAFSKRARVIVYDKNKNPNPTVTSYEDLVQGEQTVAIRSSSNYYNRMLLASIIHANGEQVARQWTRDLVAHMARPPQGNDRAQAIAVVEGIADYGVMNTYYIGLMLRNEDPKQVEAGKAIGVIFPNQNSRGTHVAVSGLAVSKYSKNKKNALALINFLLSETAQKIITNENFEYPVARNVEPNGLLLSWGTFKEDMSKTDKISAQEPLAAKIADEEGWK